MRDQAIKTLDIYVQKVKKAAADMPDTVLPPPQTGAGAVPRMSTPVQAESAAASWTGWAISSFTNKISQAAGEIQPTSSNGSAPAAPAASRPAPVTTASASVLARQAMKSPALATSSRPSTSSGGNNFGGESFFTDAEPAANNAWGEDAGDNWGEDDDATANAWGDMDDMNDDDDTTGANTPSMASSTTFAVPAKKDLPTRNTHTSGSGSVQPFGDDDEPDFAGWLASQQKSKTGGSKPLPKGLSKSNSKPATTAAAKKPVTKPAAKSAPAKKLDLKPKDTGEDGWGDAW